MDAGGGRASTRSTPSGFLPTGPCASPAAIPRRCRAFDQDPVRAQRSGAASRTPASIADEFAAVREATIQLFKNFTDEMWDRRGVAADAEVTAYWPWRLSSPATLHAPPENVIRERYLAVKRLKSYWLEALEGRHQPETL
jgi:hypothetical protein